MKQKQAKNLLAQTMCDLKTDSCMMMEAKDQGNNHLKEKEEEAWSSSSCGGRCTPNNEHSLGAHAEYVSASSRYQSNHTYAPPIPIPNYMEAQNFLNCSCSFSSVGAEEACPHCTSTAQGYAFRAEVVGWLLEVVDAMRFHPLTLHTSVAYIDRFLSVVKVKKSKLQLVGVTCLFLAAKYEEIQTISIEQFVAVCGGACTSNQIIQMEAQILYILQFNVSAETSLPPLYTLLDKTEASTAVRNVAAFLADVALLDGERCLGFRPVEMAAVVALMAHMEAKQQHIQEQYVHDYMYESVSTSPTSSACSSEDEEMEYIARSKARSSKRRMCVIDMSDIMQTIALETDVSRQTLEAGVHRLQMAVEFASSVEHGKSLKKYSPGGSDFDKIVASGIERCHLGDMHE
eukprot:m.54312 g.54312  ORF g.54312 m.54312 type:complete len:402 (+) comp10916_c1_seq1:326-1531(+)